MTRAWIGLGSNLGDSRRQIAAACTRLDELPGTSLRATSRLYRSAPWGPVAQPRYLNAVAEVETALDASGLLAALLEIESLHGRERSVRWGPRTLDLDLLLYDGETISSPQLTVPHPRLAERAFVLVPLAEIAPDIEVPGLGSVAELLSRVDAQDVTPAEGPQ